mmetsp:Transcript_2699/g.10380  ORF Transcript_2699/g.10380 Transcript_2699/m.10380 type:complete len:223 (-) Transcript_2699:513-1181(-)
MNVTVNVLWHVKVDDVGHIWNIETSGSNIGGNQHSCVSVFESIEGTLSVLLGAISVNAGSVESHLAELILYCVAISFGLCENKSESLAFLLNGLHECVNLLVILNVLNGLSNHFSGGTNASYREENVVSQETRSQVLNFLWKGGTKHHGLTNALWWHELLLDNLTNLWLESHIEHAIGLIEYKELNLLQGDIATLQEIYETPRSGHQNVAASRQCLNLFLNG